MKYMDKVQVITENEKYIKQNIKIGEIGTIIDPEIRNNTFYVIFDNHNEEEWYKYAIINIRDLKLIESSNLTDNDILKDLPKNNPSWWCKVEDGYIKNLLGEKKNKIPFNYES